ncbi:DUF4073 domain-containing protein [Neobacillus massiliamazoniensis]|uniref:Phosphohydrolase n=1 Tax=Neobacillus massiliamazoniensis TaxID=1499688 RepID=A0A0U1P3B6_9BACI|nr:DUF4073 domain-containing protein [Neobacillus massiliamazoniensis]CRK84720.1 phosphohydrolase [Neobacillus massiliamazoniensis]
MKNDKSQKKNKNSGVFEKEMNRRDFLQGTTKTAGLALGFSIFPFGGLQLNGGQTALAAANSNVITISNLDQGTGLFEVNFQGTGWGHGSDSYNNNTGAYFEFEFIGDRFRLLGAKDPRHGIAGISIDGGPEQKSDLYAPKRQPAGVYYESPELEAGKHKVKVIVTGEKNIEASNTFVVLDHIEVDIPEDTSLIQAVQADVQHAGFIQEGVHTPVILRLNQVFSDFVPKSMNIHFDNSILKVTDVTGVQEGLQVQMEEISKNAVAVKFTSKNPLKQQKTVNLAKINVKAQGKVGSTGSITIKDLVVADAVGRETVISELKVSIPITRKAIMSFNIISDIQGDTGDFDTALKQMNIINPNSKALIINGDITNGGGIGEYETVRNIINNNAVPFTIISSIGNHEFYEAKWNNYKTSEEEIFSRFYDFAGVDKPYYSKVVKGIPFIVLGTEKYMGFYQNAPDVKEQFPKWNGGIDQVYMSDKQLDFLRSQLEKYSKQNIPVFVLSHHVLKDTVSGSRQSPYLNDYMQYDEIMSILGDYPNAIFFSGHSHWTLELPDWAVNVKVSGGNKKGFTAINTGAIQTGWMSAGPNGGEVVSPEGGLFNQALQLDVFEDEVVIKGRNFRTNSWMQEYVVKIGK